MPDCFQPETPDEDLVVFFGGKDCFQMKTGSIGCGVKVTFVGLSGKRKS